jgi:hypothetical protein
MREVLSYLFSPLKYLEFRIYFKSVACSLITKMENAFAKSV